MERTTQRTRRSRPVLAGLVILIASLLAQPSAHAGPYSQLQVLLPGEVEAPGTTSGKVGTPLDQTAGLPFDVRVRACDSGWSTVTTITDLVELTSSDASATLPAAAALVNGQLTFSVTLNAGGSFTISADDQTDPSIPEAISSPVSVAVLTGFEFSRINQKNQYAGQPMSISLSAVDAAGNVVEGFEGTVRLREITSFGDGRIEPEEITLSSGSWSGDVTNFRADETNINRGNVNILAYLGADPAINGTSDPFVVHPGTFARVQVVVPGQSPAPGSLSGVTGATASQAAGQLFQVEVYATDAYWNPVPSTDGVLVSSSDPAASTPVSGNLVDGSVQFSLSLGTVGAQTLSVVDQTNPSIQGMTTDPIAVINSSAHHFEFDPIAAPVTAGQAVPVTISAVDATGNLIPDYAGDGVLTANTGPGSISPNSVTFVNGIWSGDVVIRGAGGAVSLSCADYASPPHIGTSASFEVVPGPFTGLQVLLPGETPQGGTETGVSGMPDDQQAGAEFQVTVRAVDAYWNRVPGIDHRIALESSDPFLAAPPETVLANGMLVLPATLFAAGGQTVTAADVDSTAIAAHTSRTVQVVAGTYARLLIVAPGQTPAPGSEEGRIGEATDQSINYSFTVDVYATDSWWNPVGGVSDVVRLTSTDPMAELPPDTALLDGTASLVMRLSTGGHQQITVENVTQPTIPPSTTQVRAISSGFHLEAEVHPRQVEAGAPFTLTVRVTNDAGSVIQEINSQVEIVVLNAVTQEPGAGVLENTRFQLLSGQRSIEETYTYAEPIILVASDDQGNEPAVSEVVVVDPGPPADVELASDPPWVGGNKHATVSARVVDAFENGVPAQPVTFELLSGTAALTPIDPETDQGGVARADFLSPRQPEVARVRATSNALTAELDIEVALVDPNLPAGTVTNYPNPFHPDESATTIAYKLADNASVDLRIFTLTGTLVFERSFAAGTPGGVTGLNEYQWDGLNGRGDRVSSGTYILAINAEGAGETMHVMRRRIAVVR
jgi:hypothetical protein